jgi:hypothetical protein
MGFKAFLQVSCQLVDRKVATVKIRGYDVVFETTSQGWMLSTRICSKGKVPLSLLNSIALAHLAIFDKRGVFLNRNAADGMLYLIKKTKPLHDYEVFQEAVDEYIRFADHWKSILDDTLVFTETLSLKEG